MVVVLHGKNQSLPGEKENLYMPEAKHIVDG